MSLIQIFHREDRMFEKFDKINFNHYKATQKSVLAYSIFYPVVEFIEWWRLHYWFGTEAIERSPALFHLDH